jgi:hypothetical protein
MAVNAGARRFWRRHCPEPFGSGKLRDSPELVVADSYAASIGGSRQMGKKRGRDRPME